MNIVKKVKSINLPSKEYCVIGSSVLAIYKIREARDIDFLITPRLYQSLKEDGWDESFFDDGTERINFDCFEAITVFIKKYSLKDVEVEFLEGVPIQSLRQLSEWKKEFGREKDLRDVLLIEEFLQKRKK